MQKGKISRSAFLSAKDGLRSAAEKTNKIAMDMQQNPANMVEEKDVVELVKSVGMIAEDLAEKAEVIAEVVPAEGEIAVDQEGAVMTSMDENDAGADDPKGNSTPEAKEKNNVQPSAKEVKDLHAKLKSAMDEISELKKDNEEKEKMAKAAKYASMFPEPQRAAKEQEFMAMGLPLEHMETFLTATIKNAKDLGAPAAPQKSASRYSVFSSLQKSAKQGEGRIASLAEI